MFRSLLHLRPAVYPFKTRGFYCILASRSYVQPAPFPLKSPLAPAFQAPAPGGLPAQNTRGFYCVLASRSYVQPAPKFPVAPAFQAPAPGGLPTQTRGFYCVLARGALSIPLKSPLAPTFQAPAPGGLPAQNPWVLLHFSSEELRPTRYLFIQIPFSSRFSPALEFKIIKPRLTRDRRWPANSTIVLRKGPSPKRGTCRSLGRNSFRGRPGGKLSCSK